MQDNEQNLGRTEGQISDFDPPSVKSGRDSRRDFLSRTSEGFAMSLCIVAGLINALRGNYADRLSNS